MKIINFLLISVIVWTGAFAGESGGDKKIYRASVSEKGIQRIEVVGGEYYYDPDYIIVKKGIPVELIIKKEPGIIPHNIVIKEPAAGMDIRESMSTKQKAIRFTPLKSGKYFFYCDKKLLFFKSHREKGMEGIIEVVEE